MSDVWLRPEYQGREGELETREDFARRTGVSAQSLSSMFTRYSDRNPKVAKMFGKTKYFVATELDDFVAWVRKNTGTRSEVEVKRAHVVRLKNALNGANNRVADRARDLAKAERDRDKFRRQLKRAEDDLAFLEQAE